MATGTQRRPSTDDQEGQLVESLQRVARHLVGVTARAWTAARGPVRTTLPAYRLLVLLASGPMQPSALAEQLGITRAAVTQMLGSLSRQRLVTVSRDRSDRRQRTVSITPRARRFVDAVARERARRLGPVLRSLSASERKRALSVLDLLDRALTANPDTGVVGRGGE